MTEKACNWCGDVKPLAEFGRDKYRPDGHRDECKTCRREYAREWRKNNPEKRREYERRWRERNPETYRAKKRRNDESRMRRMPERVRKLARERQRRYRERHPDRVAAYQRRYRRENREKVAEIKKVWNENNPDRIRAWGERRRSDPKYRLEAAIRAGVHRGITRGAKNGRRTFDLLGYSREELVAHLESQFEDGMSWENYGEWHIDHITPLSAFNYTTPDHIDFRRAWGLENLRPMWGEENLSKSDRLEREFQPALQLATIGGGNE